MLLKRLAKSNLSMRSHLRISIYMNREMFLYPIPNRDKDISSINTLEFLLRKHYRGIMSCVPYGKYQIRNQKRNNQNFSAIIFHYLNSPLLFTRKHYLCIVQLYNFLLLPPPKYLLLYDKSHSCSLFNNHCIYSQLDSTNPHHIQE